MKKRLFLVLWGLVVCGAFLEAQTLDESILRAALRISTDLPAGATAAVIHFRSGSERLNDYVVNELHGAILRNRRVTSVKPNETQLQTVWNGLRFNEAGEIDGESAQSIGQALGAQYLVTGSVEQTGAEYRILFTAVDTESAEVRSRYSAPLNPRDARITSLLGRGAALAGSAPSSGGVLSPTAGSLEILAVTAGTAEITGDNVQQTAEIPAGRSLPVGKFNAGSYHVVMRYEDGNTEEKTVEIEPAQAARLEFSYRNVIGSLEILAVTAGTAEITGDDVQQTAEIPAGRSLPVGEFSTGSYHVVMHYDDGKTEEKTVEIRPAQTARLRFNYRPPERLNTLGGSLGFTFSAPVFAAAIQGTVSPGKGSFFDLGAEIGLGSGQKDIEYFSLYPYARYAFFAPFTKGGGWYAGAGLGIMFATVTFLDVGKVTGTNVAGDLSTGFIFRNGITLSYTFRTDFATANSKLAVGYSYRFK